MCKRFLFFVSVFFLVLLNNVQAAEICAVVDAEDTDCADGRCNLEFALREADSNGEVDLIKVVRGIHDANTAKVGFWYNLGDGFAVRVEGGYDSQCNGRIVDPTNTIITGGGGKDTLSILQENGGDIWVEALTVRNSDNTGRAAINTHTKARPEVSSDITIYNCIVENNVAGSVFNTTGLWAYSLTAPGAQRSGSITIKDNIIRENGPNGGLGAQTYSADGDAGQVTVEGNVIEDNVRGDLRASSSMIGSQVANEGTAGQVRVVNNRFIDNRSAAFGGGVWVYSDPGKGDAEGVYVAHNVISDNQITSTSSSGGGIFLEGPASSTAGHSGADISLVNNLIADNTSKRYAGGVLIESSPPNVAGSPGERFVINNTITENEAGTDCSAGDRCNTNGVLLNLRQDSQIHFHNNIVWGNNGAGSYDLYFHADGDGTIDLTYNDFSTIHEEGILNKSNNLDVDPSFVGNEDYHLMNNSPCIDKGWNDSPRLPASDIDGDPRINDGDENGVAVVDLGADEFGVGEPQYRSYFAQWGDGGSGAVYLFSRLELVNLNQSQSALVEVEVTDDPGNPIAVEFPTSVEIPAGGAVSLTTDGKGTLVSGAVTVTSTQRLTGTIVFGGSVGLAGVPQSLPVRGCIAPVRMNSDSGVSSGVAIMGVGQPVTVQFTLRDQQGTLVARATESLGAKGHKALMLNQLGWDSSVDWSSFSGSLEMTAGAEFGATVILLAPNQYATLPVTEID